jgi:hypothetical protein
MLLETMVRGIGVGLPDNSSSLRACPGLQSPGPVCERCFGVVAVPSKTWAAACRRATDVP